MDPDVLGEHGVLDYEARYPDGDVVLCGQHSVLQDGRVGWYVSVNLGLRVLDQGGNGLGRGVTAPDLNGDVLGRGEIAPDPNGDDLGRVGTVLDPNVDVLGRGGIAPDPNGGVLDQGGRVLVLDEPVHPHGHDTDVG